MPAAMYVKRLLYLAVALGGCLPWCAARAARSLEPEDWYRFRDVWNLEMAADGSAVAYLVTSYDRRSDQSLDALWLADWSGGAARQLTHGASVGEPRFTPDGRRLSFLAARPQGATTQLWVIDRNGGAARRLSQCAGEITSYAWSPDARRVVLAMHAAEDARSPAPEVIDAYQFKDKYAYLTARARTHLYLLDAASGACRAMSADPERADSMPIFSPDGRQIAFVGRSTQTPAEAGRDAIYVVDATAAASPRQLASHWSAAHPRLAWSRDGRRIAFLYGDDPKDNIWMQHVALVEVASGRVQPVAPGLDRTLISPVWSADGGSLLLAVEDDGRQYAARVRLDRDAVERLTGAMVIDELTSAAGHTAVLASSDRAPFEVFALEAGGLRPLSAHNRALFAQLALGAVEDIAFASRDGTPIHGQLVKPPDFRPGQRYPTILWIKGGPDGQDDHSLTLESYGPELERQLFATHGYLVLAINHRGSTGRGAGFARAITADWGHRDVEDLLAGVDYAIAQGSADPAHLGVGGWSYGGMLTDYLIASDTRFKAAVSGAGSANQLAAYGTDAWVVADDRELGPPWRNTALWLRLSYPFLHADRVRTPTLFVGGDRDFNVPIAGCEQMYQALRTLGVPAQLIVYPGEGHYLTRPSFMVDLYRRYLAWMDEYLRAGDASYRPR